MMLEVKNLSTGYGAAHVIDDLSFSIGDGGALALLGRNGAGKSTTIKAVMGLLSLNGGEINFRGRTITHERADAIARLGVGYVPEDRRVFSGLTVTENLLTGAKPGPSGKVAWTEARLFDLFPEIARRRDSLAATLSGGERQMLAIARAMMGNPDLLILDEPSEGLAPIVVQRLAATLKELRQENVAFLIAEQNRALAGEVADRVAILETGKMRFHGSFDDMRANPEIIAAHLGV